MRVLVMGAGATEHALVARLTAEREVAEVVGAPGNPGISAVARTVPADLSRPDELSALADRERIDLTIIGPELPLSLGVADRFCRRPPSAVRTHLRSGATGIEQVVR